MTTTARGYELHAPHSFERGNLLRSLLVTGRSWAPLVARLALGIVIFPHGAQKLLGWFGGPGFSAAVQNFEQMGFPAWLGVVEILVEFLAPLALIIGALTRLAAAGIAVIMVVAATTVHLPYGFFMAWMGQKQGEGFEFHILAVGLALVLMIAGGGQASVDRALTHSPPG